MSPCRPVFLVLTFSIIACGALWLHADEAAQLKFFEEKIRPVLAEHCYSCHAADAKIVRGGLVLDSRDGVAKGGESGEATLVSGQPQQSLLVKAIKHESLEMPPDYKLAPEVVADFETWIRDGAIDPREQTAQSRLKPVDWDAAKSHWAFQRLTFPDPPCGDSSWGSSPIDNFVFQKLQANGLSPSAPADKRTLIRRATFDLIGLPPTPQEVADFLADESPDAFAKVIDRLLASPAYGERWGRHWLDLVRYATSNGADENHDFPTAWRYRDWVVRAINNDLPIDQFITHQLAGDLLPAPEDEQAAGDLLTATGMLVIGPKMLAEQDKDKMVIDIVDEQLDTVSRTMFGLTVSCARCHDHKFDPISTRDYYSFAGIFYSTQAMANRDFVSQWMERPLPSQEITAARTAHQVKIDAAKTHLTRLKEESAEEEAQKSQQAVVEKLEKEMPAYKTAMATQEGTAKDLPVHIRGNHLKLGDEAIPRGMPVILTSTHAAAPIQSGSGRLELARWLTSPEHPLTARVMMNRVWMWHFGKGLMRTPSNWGLKAEPPTHPELLDWLSGELIRNDWSLKEMHRTIMMSATYQMSSANSDQLQQVDPENRLLARQNRRRLEAEPIRDSILSVGDLLEHDMGAMAGGVDAKRRAIYLPVNRAAFYEMFSTFDYVENANHVEQRPVTIVPTQALFMMNSDLVHQSARKITEQLIAPDEQSVDARATVSALFERLYARPCSEAELKRCIEFIESAKQTAGLNQDSLEPHRQAWAALCRTLMAANEFIYVD